MEKPGPGSVSARLLRIASALETAKRPSLSKLSKEIGKVILALETEEAAQEADPREGALAVPTGQMISLLGRWLSMKYALDAAYRSYADRLHGPWRDALVAHWQEHSGEERGHAYDIAMKVVGLGGDPALLTMPVPACPANRVGCFMTLMQLELDAIELGRQIAEASGTATALRVMAENILLTDTQHLDDLRRMLSDAGAG